MSRQRSDGDNPLPPYSFYSCLGSTAKSEFDQNCNIDGIIQVKTKRPSEAVVKRRCERDYDFVYISFQGLRLYTCVPDVVQPVSDAQWQYPFAFLLVPTPPHSNLIDAVP